MQRMTNWIGHLKAQHGSNIFVLQNLTIVCWQTNIWHSNSPKAYLVNVLVLAYFTFVILDCCRRNSANWLNCWLITIPQFHVPLAASWALGKDATRISIWRSCQGPKICCPRPAPPSKLTKTLMPYHFWYVSKCMYLWSFVFYHIAEELW